MSNSQLYVRQQLIHTIQQHVDEYTPGIIWGTYSKSYKFDMKCENVKKYSIVISKIVPWFGINQHYVVHALSPCTGFIKGYMGKYETVKDCLEFIDMLEDTTRYCTDTDGTLKRVNGCTRYTRDKEQVRLEKTAFWLTILESIPMSKY
jgi:hypothetical protein